MSCPLRSVAGHAQNLQIVAMTTTAKPQRHNMIYFIFFLEADFAVSAPIMLHQQYFGDIFGGMRAAVGPFPRSPI
jgi:hypothetical protein